MELEAMAVAGASSKCSSGSRKSLFGGVLRVLVRLPPETPLNRSDFLSRGIAEMGGDRVEKETPS